MEIYNHNIQLQMIALVMLGMILSLFYGRNKLRITRERTFAVLLWTTMASILLDIASVIVAENEMLIPIEAGNIIRGMYLLSVVATSYTILLYTMTEIYLSDAFVMIIKYGWIVPLVVCIPIVLNTPITSGSGEVYSFGTAVYVSMGFTVFYIVSCWGYALKNRSRLDRFRFSAIILAGVVFFGCGLFQLFFQQWRLMSLGISLVIIYIYLGLENPDEFIDKTHDLFNREAYDIYIKNTCSDRRPLSICLVKVQDISELGSVATNEIMRRFEFEFVSFLKGIDKATVFEINSREYALCFKHSEHFMEQVNVIRGRVDQPWMIGGEDSWLEIEVRAKIVAYPSIRMPQNKSYEEITQNLAFFMRKLDFSNAQNFICIDRRQLREREKYDQARAEIMDSIKLDRVDIFLQPVFSVYENRYVEAEAFVRVKDSNGMYLENTQLIPLAEECGAIREIGTIAFEKICKFVAENKFEASGIKRINVNLSPIECQDRHLAERFIEIMDKYNVSASFFAFEISEACARFSSQNLRRNLNQFTTYGASVLIHDYGTTEMNPDICTRISPNEVKLSKELIAGYFSGRISRQYMRSLCRMLVQLKITITAVGVENQYQFSELKMIGISQMQGYAFFHPMPCAELLETLEMESTSGLEQEVLLERVL